MYNTIHPCQQTFQRRFNVAFRLKWRRDVAQRQINVETTLCTSALKFTNFNNVVYFNVELNNVRQRRNNVAVFNVNFHNVGQRRNNVANMSISIKNKNTLCAVTIAMICSNLASLWKFQYFRRPIYNPVEHVWWSFYCKNKAVKYIHKKLHHRCLLGF